MAPFEALYGRKCRSPLCWDEVGERRLRGLDILVQTTEVLAGKYIKEIVRLHRVPASIVSDRDMRF